MSLWSPLGTKPKFLTEDEKKLVYATASGWVLEAGAESARLTGNNNPDAQPEVLVAIGDLATSMSSATITEIEFITTSFSKAAGGTFSMRVRFDEEVTVDTSGGTPHFVINNTTNAARHQTCLYASGSGTNELVFSKTLGTNSADVNANDVLNVIANPITLNSGTIKDKGTTTDSDITSVLSIGSAAGTLTVAA